MEASKPTLRHGPLRAIVADDDTFARRIVKETLQAAGITVIAEARNGHEAVELVLYYRPDIVVMDIVMPELDGIAATRRILKQLPDQAVVLLTGSDDDLGILGLRSGAVGFLTKDLDLEGLPRALAGAVSGEGVISRVLARRLIEHVRKVPELGSGMRPIKSPLTGREWEVVDLLAAGKSTEQMAEALVVSTETVRSHVKSILKKLNVSSRAEAVVIAERMRDGLD
jgi:NarL family two-component system response regulator LiaR